MFSLAATSREFGYSAMGLKLPDTIAYGGHRNIKISTDGLVALRLSRLGYNLVSDVLRQFSCFLYFIRADCGTHSDTKQQNDSFSPFKLIEGVIFILQAPLITPGEFNSKVKENHLLEI